jgi:hypothetical protein
MKRTEDEYAALDQKYSKAVPNAGANGSGFVSRREARLMGLDALAADYLETKAKATHKTPQEIIGLLVRKEIGMTAAL